MDAFSDSDRNPVEELAEEFVARYRRGERPALAEYTDRYPQWADKIRVLFPALVVMERTPGADGALYAVRHLERISLGTAYTAVVDRVARLFSGPPLAASFGRKARVQPSSLSGAMANTSMPAGGPAAYTRSTLAGGRISRPVASTTGVCAGQPSARKKRTMTLISDFTRTPRCDGRWRPT